MILITEKKLFSRKMVKVTDMYYNEIILVHPIDGISALNVPSGLVCQGRLSFMTQRRKERSLLDTIEMSGC